MSKQPRRELLLETAYRLFNEYGYHATGIDLILAESGVSKATLYKYFRTKEELILEVLRRRHVEFEGMVKAFVEQNRDREAASHKRILLFFDVLHEWINSKRFFGCNFINASAEYGAQDDPIHHYAAQHKESLRDGMEALLTGLKKAQRGALADQLLMLVDGAIVSAQVRGDKNSALTAKGAARALLESAGVALK